MMAGFSHDIAGGNGNLVVTSVQSPNFVHGVSGWRIARDGSAEFHSISLPSGSGGATIYFASSAPASPNAGDLWYDTANGLQVSQWNGTAWTAYQLGTNAIANGAITAALIQAGTIVAGIVDGTTIMGAQVIADGTSGDFLAFTGTPASNNLLASISPASGSYAGAAYVPGIGVYSGPGQPYIQIYVEGTSPNIVPVIFLAPNRANDNPASITLDIGNLGLANEYVETYWNGPTVTQQGDGARIRQYSSSQDKTIPAAGDLAYHDAAGTDHTYLSWSAAGTALVGTVQGVNAGTGTVASPAAAAPWVSVGMGNGWVNRGSGYPPFRVKLLAEKNRLAINGQMTAGTKADGTVIATFGGSYTPAYTQQVTVTGNLAAAGNYDPLLIINTSGQVICYGCSATTYVAVNASIPLD